MNSYHSRKHFVIRKSSKNKLILFLRLRLVKKNIFNFRNFLITQKEVDAI